MGQRNDDPKTGPGTTSDPNQADRTGPPKRHRLSEARRRSDTPPQRNPDPETGPGTTRDPNQADRT